LQAAAASSIVQICQENQGFYDVAMLGFLYGIYMEIGGFRAAFLRAVDSYRNWVFYCGWNGCCSEWQAGADGSAEAA
jgi:hypothetical protein